MDFAVFVSLSSLLYLTVVLVCFKDGDFLCENEKNDFYAVLGLFLAGFSTFFSLKLSYEEWKSLCE